MELRDLIELAVEEKAPAGSNECNEFRSTHNSCEGCQHSNLCSFYVNTMIKIMDLYHKKGNCKESIEEGAILLYNEVAIYKAGILN